MERPINPPEPTCPRCRKICWPDQLEYFCPECGQPITELKCSCGWRALKDDDWDSAKSKCPHCGFDGSEDTCVVCKKPIAPSSGNYGYSICEPCEDEGHRQRWEDEGYPEETLIPDEELPQDVENELYAISVGCTTEEEIDALYNNKPEEGDAS